MRSIYDYNYMELESWLVENNEKKFRTKQVFEWLYDKKVNNFLMMSNLSGDLISKLEENFLLDTLVLKTKESDVDVNKYLFKLSTDDFIEAVVMRHNYGYSVCISTQVGCNMGCSFCESGKLKKVRNLELNEMLEPILFIEKDLSIKVSRVVLMGIGEPFDNYDNVMKFVKHINDYRVLNIGSRHITISTCGIIPKIEQFSKEDGQVNLAISLHAPNDKLRSELMCINNAYNIKDLIACLDNYIKITNRRVTFEYILLDGINDSIKCANELVDLLHGMNAYVNLIPYNSTSTLDYKRSTKESIDSFYKVLASRKINVTLRREFGSKISGACGQLSSKGDK